ncbi:hypothetical protein [Nitratireductor basaltis]|uniref:Uncharacterized protein n=1 Tax=Nitratireductor basaltis TaxID=472175 RepID=A0A084U9S8_9HYPH|nr:hypothetical protein [Nitratireductor basaltis]KFB09714.1 hypothetical protein EL18_00731 [Nitratireductor basaltis]
MHKQFDELKKQLNELSETLNRFESEAVQLRIVELLFKQQDGDGLSENGSVYQAGPGAQGIEWIGDRGDILHRGRPRRGRKTAPSASGAVAALSDLLKGEFFNERRTIGDIVKRCETELGMRYKSNAFSGPLSRYAKSGVLLREKNDEGKFVYFKAPAE